MFRDRSEAGKRLADALVDYKDQPAVIYALPRGGVIVGVEIARKLDAPLDLIIVRKVGHPAQPEYAIGAVTADGYVVMNTAETDLQDREWVEKAIASELNAARRRREVFLDRRKTIDARNKVAIIVDDGLATGFTMQAAIHEIRRRDPQRIVVAVPVAAQQTADSIRSMVDELVVLEVPQGYFGAIGAFYLDFSQVSDEEVVALMRSFPPLPTGSTDAI